MAGYFGEPLPGYIGTRRHRLYQELNIEQDELLKTLEVFTKLTGHKRILKKVKDPNNFQELEDATRTLIEQNRSLLSDCRKHGLIKWAS